MLLKQSIFILILICLSVTSSAQENTQIAGHAADFVGHKAYVYGYHDFISESKELLDSATIASDGSFTLSFETTEIRYVELVSDYIAANLYTEPGTHYDIDLPLPESTQPKAFGRKAKTEVIFNNLALDDINALIIDFNYNYELFFQSNYETLRKLFAPRNYATLTDSVARPSSAITSVMQLFEETGKFSTQMDSIYKAWDSPYFKLYRSAVMGDLTMNSSATPREIYETYIAPYPFAAQHPEFTRLHERFYKFYFARYSQSYGEEELNATLNQDGDYSALKVLFSKDDFLADPERMDVIINLAIEEVWANRGMNHTSLIEVLQKMRNDGASSMTQAMATAMIDKLTAAKKGFSPRDIEFEDQFKDRKRISDYVGTPLLIEFWAPWCSNCSIEKEHLLSLTERYDDVIKIVSVEVLESGKEPVGQDDCEACISTHTPSESEWISSYQVRSLPYYLLIGADGKIMKDNCPMPSDGLEAILHKLQADAKSSRKQGVGLKEN
jgi:thiol-disulfide isomerase/thioredoxin